MGSKKNRKKKRPGKKSQQRRKKQPSAGSYDRLLAQVKKRELLPTDTQYIVEPPGETKMSEVILDFAMPFLEEAPDSQAKQSMIGVAILAWNISLLPFFSRRTALKNAQADINMDKEGIKVIKMFVRMIKRYRRRFHPNLKRFILDFELTETRGELNLNVVSTISPSEEQNFLK